MKKLAQAIMDAAKIREESFDNIAADEAQKKSFCEHNKFSAVGDHTKAAYALAVDYTQFYTKTLGEACQESAELHGLTEDDAEFISSILFTMWNDAIEWAERRLSDDKKGNFSDGMEK